MEIDISNLKYNEMQKIAKQVGIKANMKFDRLKTALIEYYQQEHKEKEQNIAETEREAVNSKDIEISEVPNKEENLSESKSSERKKVKSKRTVKKKTSSQNEKSNDDAALPKPKSTVTVVKPLKPSSAKNTPVQKTVKSVKVTGKQTPTGTLSSKKSTPAKTNNLHVTIPLSEAENAAQKRKEPETPRTEEKPSKRTRNSFEKSTIPVVESSPRSVSRRSTFSVEKVKKEPSVSPGVQDLVTAMDTNKSDEEMKQNLIQALDKKVQEKSQISNKKENITNSTQIPRFAAFLEKKKQEQNKPITPGNKDWTKIHQKEFEKFDSIDVYLEKKRKHREETSMSVKKARLLVEQTKEAINRLKNHKTPCKENKVRPSTSKTELLLKSPGFTSTKAPFKPTVLSTKQMNLNFSQTRKSPRNSGFKPTVTSTDKMNLNFGALKTPLAFDTKTPKTDPRKSTGSMPERKSFATPFKFSATLNNTVDASRSTKKPAFDLKASLTRPMTWKAHKGKLKSIKDSYLQCNSEKSVKTQAREERRTSAMNKRAEHKFNAQMANRGIVQ